MTPYPMICPRCGEREAVKSGLCQECYDEYEACLEELPGPSKRDEDADEDGE